MKRVWISALAAVLVLSLAACGGRSRPEETAPPASSPAVSQAEPVTLQLWTYPIGGWQNSGTVSGLISSFHQAYPNIRITVKYLDYDTGDRLVEDAISAGEQPDLVLEGPERLSANWGVRGLMADLSDLWESESAGAVYPQVREACRSGGAYYIYPLCMTTHCMAINRDLFEAAGAWQYIDEQTHTWSTEGFLSALEALRAYGVENIAAVYCKNQAGDQGTRALVNNLFGGSFTDPEHSRYTLDSPENIRALELLAGEEGIRFDSGISGSDELVLFSSGELAMAFCWNVSMEIGQTIGNPLLDFDIFPMAFPTSAGEPRLQGGIWGFGVFDKGDESRVQAAKTFIRYMLENDSQYTRSVLASTYWPVRELPGIYDNDELMTEYAIFHRYLGDYYQVTPGWAEARRAWWTMLQEIGAGGSVPEAAAAFDAAANAAAGVS